MYTVKAITRNECETYILKIHYAHRWPSITWAFGLFTSKDISKDNELCGIITYGTPPSSTLRNHIAGYENERYIIELNRLCLKYNRKYEASILVSRSIKLLPKNKLIVSYADTGQDHVGTVYQATNFLYCGLSAKFKDPKIKGLEHQHHATYAKGFTNTQLIEKYGEKVYFVDRPRKHRYIYFNCNKKWRKKELLKKLNYKILPYPKAQK